MKSSYALSIYFIIAMLHMFYIIGTYECDDYNKKYNAGQCMPDAFAAGYFQSLVWPLTIVYKVTH